MNMNWSYPPVAIFGDECSVMNSMVQPSCIVVLLNKILVLYSTVVNCVFEGGIYQTFLKIKLVNCFI